MQQPVSPQQWPVSHTYGWLFTPGQSSWACRDTAAPSAPPASRRPPPARPPPCASPAAPGPAAPPRPTRTAPPCPTEAVAALPWRPYGRPGRPPASVPASIPPRRPAPVPNPLVARAAAAAIAPGAAPAPPPPAANGLLPRGRDPIGCAATLPATQSGFAFAPNNSRQRRAEGPPRGRLTPLRHSEPAPPSGAEDWAGSGRLTCAPAIRLEKRQPTSCGPIGRDECASTP